MTPQNDQNSPKISKMTKIPRNLKTTKKKKNPKTSEMTKIA